MSCSKQVHTPVVLFHSLLDKYPWERYETTYPPSYWLNSSRRMALALNNLQRLICHLTKKPNQTSFMSFD